MMWELSLSGSLLRRNHLFLACPFVLWSFSFLTFSVSSQRFSNIASSFWTTSLNCF